MTDFRPLPTPDPHPGDTVGEWVVTDLVGRGGMAVVFRVEHTATREVRALKLLLVQMSGDGARDRFEREFRALSSLDHPNVIRVFGTGTWGNRPWYVMEWMDGHDLRVELERWRDLPPAERFRRAEDVLVQAASALAHVHARGFVHRDVSPSNLMVLPDGRVKLTDFGVVKGLGGDLTAADELVGTVAWIAPEQFSGARVDERADLYALGAVLYMMLTGRRPFHARTLAGYLEKHLHGRPRPPREIQPDVPPHLDEACLRLLAKDPADRFASASHLLHFVRTGGPASLDVRSGRWPDRTVGRAAETAVLREALAAVEAGAGGVVLLEGPSGSGKTHLLEDLAALARTRGVAVLQGICGKSGQRAFSGWAEVYGTLAAGREAPEVLRRMFEPEDDRAPAVPVERYAIYAAFLELLKGGPPRVILLDGVQRADSGTAGLAEYLVRNLLGLAREPVLFVLARWPPAQAFDPLAGLATAESTGVPVQTVPLGPLSVAAVEDLLLDLVPGDRQAAMLARRIHRETEGNTHFVVEMIRGLVEERVIRPDRDGRPHVAADLARIARSGLPLPPSLKAALHDRVAPLDPEARQVALALAVARQEVSLEVLCRVLGTEASALQPSIDALAEAGIVRIRRVGSEDRLDIRHNGLRDVLLEEADPAGVCDLHRALGAVFERLHRGRLGPVLETVAWHFEQADLPGKACQYLVRSGEHLLSRSFVEEALAAFDRALASEPAARATLVLDDADRNLVRLQLGRARACAHLGRWEEADAETRSAHRLAGELGDARLLGQTWFEMGQMHRRHTDLDAAGAALEEALRLAEQEADARLRVQALNRSAGVLWARGDLDAARRAWIQVLALGDTTRDAHSVAVGHAGLGLLAVCRGQSAEARRYLEQACSDYEALGALDHLTVTRVNLVELYHLTGNLRRGLLLADKTLAQAREIRYQEGMALGLRYRALVLVSLGRLAEARAHVEEALSILRAQGNAEEELGCLHSMVRIAIYREDAEEAGRWLAATEALLDRYDVEGIAPVVHAWRALIEAWRGARDATLAAIALSDHVQGRRWPLHLCRVDLVVARALRAVGEQATAQARARAALERAESAGYRLYVMKAHALLGGIVEDAAAAAHHRRVGEALARSLAANIPPEDAPSFLAFHGFEPPTPVAGAGS